MANAVIRIEWTKIGNLGHDELVATLGGAQYLSANGTSPVMSNAANTSSVNTGYPIANNTGCYARVTCCSANAGTVLVSSNTGLTFTEDLGYRINPNQTVYLKASTGSVLYLVASAN